MTVEPTDLHSELKEEGKAVTITAERVEEGRSATRPFTPRPPAHFPEGPSKTFWLSLYVDG